MMAAGLSKANLGAPSHDDRTTLAILLVGLFGLAAGLFGIARGVGWVLPIPESEWFARAGAVILGIGWVAFGVYTAGAALWIALRGGRER